MEKYCLQDSQQVKIADVCRSDQSYKNEVDVSALKERPRYLTKEDIYRDDPRYFLRCQTTFGSSKYQTLIEIHAEWVRVARL